MVSENIGMDMDGGHEVSPQAHTGAVEEYTDEELAGALDFGLPPRMNEDGEIRDNDPSQTQH